MKPAVPSLLHLENPIDQISITVLIRKSQGDLQPIPLQLCSEFGFSENDHTGMEIDASGQRDEVPALTVTTTWSLEKA